PYRDHAQHDGIGENDGDDLRDQRTEIQVAVAHLASCYACHHFEIAVVTVEYRGDAGQAEAPQPRPDRRAPQSPEAEHHQRTGYPHGGAHDEDVEAQYPSAAVHHSGEQFREKQDGHNPDAHINVRVGREERGAEADVTNVHEYAETQGYLGIEGHVGKYAVGEDVAQFVAARIVDVFGERGQRTAPVGEQEAGQGVSHERQPHDRFFVDNPRECEAGDEEEYLEQSLVYPACEAGLAERVVYLPREDTACGDEQYEERDEVGAGRAGDDREEKHQRQAGEDRGGEQQPHHEVGLPVCRSGGDTPQVALEVERPDVGEQEEGSAVKRIADDVVADHHAEDELQEVCIHVGQAQCDVYSV